MRVAPSVEISLVNTLAEIRPSRKALSGFDICHLLSSARIRPIAGDFSVAYVSRITCEDRVWDGKNKYSPRKHGCSQEDIRPVMRTREAKFAFALPLRTGYDCVPICKSDSPVGRQRDEEGGPAESKDTLDGESAALEYGVSDSEREINRLSFWNSLGLPAPEWQDESTAPPVHEDLIRQYVRRELARQEFNEVRYNVTHFRSWARVLCRIGVEEFRERQRQSK